jgi:hypothetical protein
MKISIRDLLWLTVLVAVLLAWWLQWRTFQREREAMNAWKAKSRVIPLLTQQYIVQEAEVSQLTTKVNALEATEKSGESSLQLEFAQSDLQRAEAFRGAIAARIAKLSGDASAFAK